MTAVRVVIVEVQLKQYRKRFFLELERYLRERNIELRILYSEPAGSDVAKRDTVDLDPPLGVRVPAIWLLGGRVLVQPIWRHLAAADLVITEQGNKLAFNYVLLAMSRLGLKRVAFWGHGYNHQRQQPGWSDWLKRRLLTKVDWWFSYTPEVTRYLVANGVAPATISTVWNTTDTDELADAIAALTEPQLKEVRAGLGVADNATIALYCGALTAEKDPEFLIAAARAIRARVPTFELVIIGDGPERATVDQAARALPYIHPVGARFGVARAPYFAIADAFVMPTLVGLAIVDAFVAGLPMFTTSLPTHGPEIEYLRDGENGAMLAHDATAFASGVAAVLEDPKRLAAMRRKARDSATGLSLSTMTQAFTDGILGCLGR